MKNILTLSFLLIFGYCSVFFCQNNDFSKAYPVDSTENSQNNIAVTNSSDAELKKELSGKYVGILEVSLGGEMYDYKNGSVYFDLTVDPIVFIYSGVIINSNYYSGNKQILSNILSKYNDQFETTFKGWFEKINGQWVFWQTFEGYDEEGLGNRKPDYITKTTNLESCKSEIDSYFSQEAIFKEYWDKFKQAILNEDINALSNFVKFPIEDNVSNWTEKRPVINSASEFYHRIMMYLNESQTSPEVFFDKECYKVMEISYDFTGCYIFNGGIFNLVFDKINGEYKVVTLAAWG